MYKYNFLFADKKITLDLLQYLSLERLAELIPDKGDRLRFLLNYGKILGNVSS